MRKKIYTRLAAGLLCGALLLTDAASLDAWAASNDPSAEQIMSVEEIDEEEEHTETAAAEETDEEDTENPDQEADAPEGDDAPVVKDDEEAALPVEEEQESVSEEGQTSVSENTPEEEQDSVSKNTMEEEANANSVMTASEEIIASGTSNDISWEIDRNGKLTVSGSGDFERKNEQVAPWYDYRGTIKTAEINVRNMTNASYLFSECGNLTTLDVSNFDTSSVTDMSHMFIYCKNLTELDVSNFDTNKVTDMSDMFGFCRNLTELDLSNFNTGNVTDMSGMFSYCTNLTTIRTPRNVMDYVELPFTPGYTWYDSDDNELSELPLNLNDSVTLKRQEDPSIIAKGTSRDLSWIIDRYGTLFVSGTGNYERKDGKYAPWYDYKASIETAEVSVTGMTDASYMFSDCENLTGISLDSYSNHLTNLSEMFAGCTGLTQLDLSSLLTDSATDTSGMFRGCENLTSLALCYSDVSNVTDMSNMFAACRDLTDIYTPLNLTHSVSLPSANEAKWYRSDGSVVTELPQNLSYSVALKKNETPADIASGTSGDVSWVIDADRKLTVSGTGDYIRDSDNYAPWYEHANSIKTAEVTVTGMTDASYMFAYCENLTSINLAKFDTSKVTDMSYMFGSCRNLTELDVSNFDTGSVTDMRGMFSYCKYHLTTLDLSSFNTGSVTDMSYMFEECSELQTLNLSNFDTGNVTNMRGMFLEAFNLTTIYTPRNVKQNVELPVRLGETWYRSDGTVVTELPQNLDYSVALGKNYTPTEKTPGEDDPADIASGISNDISWVIDADGKLTVSGTGDWERSDGKYAPWYDDRESITTAEISISREGIKNASYMFYGCNNLTTLDVNNFKTGKVLDMSSMFEGCSKLDTLDFNTRNFYTGNVTDMSSMFEGCKSLTTLDVSNFKTSRVKDMSRMFYGCSNLTTLNLKSNTRRVTNMSSMFEGCKSLTTLDVSNFNTSNVTNMSRMFYGCSNLIELDLGSFDMQNVVTAAGMLMIAHLTCIYTPLNLSQSVSLPSVSEAWYRSDGTVVTELPQNLNYSVVLVLGSIPTNVASGESNDISWVINADRKLTVSGTGDWKRRAKYAPWYGYRESIRSAEVSVTDMTDASYMFYGCSKLTMLDVSNFNTASVMDMSNMFYHCNNLTALDVSHFDTSNVTNMSGMFYVCSKLNTLDVSKFDTASVTDMSDMFYLCNLTALDVSHFDTSNVTNMSGMFYCSELNTLDVSKFDTANVTDMSYMFEECSELQTLNLSNFDTSNVTNMSGMFYDCYNLTTLDVSHFDTSNVTDMSGMFYECSELNALDVSKFDTANVTDMSDMFYECYNLTTIYTPRNVKQSVELPADYGDIWYRSDGTEVTELPQNLDYSVALGRNYTPTEKTPGEDDPVDIASGKSNDISWVIDTNGKLTVSGTGNYERKDGKYAPWYDYKASIETAEVSVTGMTDASYMFSDCETLTELDVSNFNTASVTDMSYMFEECSELQTLDLSNFDTVNATNMSGMFLEAFNLTTICTPRNVKQNVELPVRLGEIWYRSDDGTMVTQLPRDEKDSILITKTKNSNPPDDDPKDDNNDGVDPKDIPQDGIPNGLWISEIADQTYTGTAIKPEVRVYDSNRRLKQGTDYTLSYQNNTKAAQAGDDKPPTVVVKGRGNYAGTETKTFTITKRNISDTYVTKAFTDAYASLENGNNPKLVFSAKCNNKALKKNTDYTLTVKNSAGNEVTSYGAAGTYTAIVKGAGNFTGEYSFSFEVLNKVPVSKLKISKIAAVKYDGTSKTPEPVIKYGKVTLTKDTDYSLNYQNNTAIGTATIEITGMGDYFGTRNVTFSITGLQIKKVKFTGFVKSFPYTGAEIRQTETVLKYGDEELKENRDYTVSYSNHRNKGKAAVTYTGIGKYTGTLKKTYSITAYNIAKDDQKRIKLSTDTISAVYAKGGAKPSLKVYDGTRLLTEGTDYTLTYQNNAAVTTSATLRQPTITVKGKGNYTGTLSEKKTFTITAKNIAEVTATAPDAAVSTRIGKYKSTPVLTDTNGKKLKAGTDYDRAYTYTYNTTTEKVHNNGAEVTRNAGDPVDALDIVPANTVLCVHVTAKGNYTGETTAEYRIAATLINKAKITVKNPAQNNANLFPYTGQAIRLEKSSLTVKVGRDVLSDDQYEILEDTYKNNVGKGTASVQIKGVGNYGGTATVKFKIGTKGFQWVKRLFG